MLKPNTARWCATHALAAVALASLLATVLHAQTSITGKWQGKTSNGLEVVLDLKAADGVLTGTLTRRSTTDAQRDVEQTSTITNGKVSATSFSFTAMLGEAREALTGEIDGMQLKVWLDRQGRDGAVVFERVKDSTPRSREVAGRRRY